MMLFASKIQSRYCNIEQINAFNNVNRSPDIQQCRVEAEKSQTFNFEMKI